MKILMLSSYLPFPLHSGGHIRLYNILKELSKEHEITLVCEKRLSQTESDIEEVEKVCSKVIAVERRTQWTFANLFRAGFSLQPFLIVGHTNLFLQQALKRELSTNNYDLIHVETFYVMQNLPEELSIPTVLVEHNIEYLVYTRFANNALIPLRPLLHWDIWKLKRIETSFWKKATKLVAVSEEEKMLMNRDDVVVVPNGVDTTKFEVRESKLGKNKKEKTILFIGDFKWIQNRDAVEWIVKEIWPMISLKFEVRSSKFRLKLWIVGKNIQQSLKRLSNDERIVFDEHAPEQTEEIYQKADVLIAPIRVGGGTSYKILEAMASGVPVVTTTLGAEGLGVSHKKELLIANDATELAESTVSLFLDKEFRARLVSAARDHVTKTFSWKMIATKLESVYKSVI